MSDDDIIKNTQTRFSVFVPQPAARINMGKPDDDNHFGYQGMSLQSGVHLLVDVNKISLYQAGYDTCWQAGARWLQYSNKNNYTTTGKAMHLSAGNKITIAAGAGQGMITQLDHSLNGAAPRPTEFNNLDLHYRVDELHLGLKQFFYGEQDRWQEQAKKSQSDQVDFYKTAGAYATAPPPPAPPPKKGPVPPPPNEGFLDRLQTFLLQFGKDDDEAKRLLQSFEWEGDRKTMTRGQGSVFSALDTFDPYPAQSYGGTGTAMYASITQAINWINRFVDVSRKLAPAITDNFLGKKLQLVISMWGDAHEAVTSALNVALIAGYNRGKGKGGIDQNPWSGEGGEWANVLARKPNFSSTKTKAILTSKDGPFVIDDEEETKIEVQDKEGGDKREVDFANLLHEEKATIVLNVVATFEEVEVKTSGPGTISLNGATFGFDGTSWSPAFPASPYEWADADHSKVKKTGGGSISVTSSGGVAISGEGPFGANGSLVVTVDGVSHAIALASLKDGASARAGQLVGLINAACGNVASANGSQVTITSLREGRAGSVSGSSVEELGSYVGASSVVGKAYSGVITAAQLRSKIGSGDFVVTGDSNAIITHNKEGEESFLSLEGHLNQTFFGSDPAEAEGTETFGEPSFENYESVESIQYEMAKWPEDIRNQLRPITNAIADAANALNKTKAVVDEAMGFAGEVEVQKSIGLIAGNGITVAGGGPLYQMGANVTIVAAKKAKGADTQKFIPGVEKFFNWFLNTDPWQESFSKLFEPKPKPALEPEGNFRVVAAAGVSLTAALEMDLVSVGGAKLKGSEVAVIATGEASLESRGSGVTVRGADVTIGDLVQDAKAPKQKVTEKINVRSSESIDLFNPHVRLVLDDKEVKIGTADATVKIVTLTAPHLLVGEDEITIGVTDGAVEVKKAGNIALRGKDTVTATAASTISLTVGTNAVTVASAGVTTTGVFEVSGALKVMGSAGPVSITPPMVDTTQILIAKVTADKAAVTADYALWLIDAGIAAAKKKALAIIVEAARQAIPLSVLNPIGAKPLRDAYLTLREQEKALDIQILALKQKQRAVLGQGDVLKMPRTDVGWVQAHDAIFDT